MAKSGKTRILSGQAEPVRYQVFISHANADKWIARMLCEKIDSLGAATFRDDRDIKGGDDIPDEIVRQIKASDEVLILLTPQSVSRPWVLLEAGMAIARRKRIIPVMYHVTTDPIPSMIKTKKAYNLNDVDLYLEELQARMHG